MVTRREFLDTLAVGAAGIAISSTAKSYRQITGSTIGSILRSSVFIHEPMPIFPR